MAKQIRKETVANLTQRFGNLRAAVADLTSEREALEQGVVAKSLTPAGMRDAIARINKLSFKADEEATYLASVFAGYVSAVGATKPQVIVDLFTMLKDEVEGIVDVVNDEKSEIRAKAEERKALEVAEKAREMIAAMNAEKAEKAKASAKPEK